MKYVKVQGISTTCKVLCATKRFIQILTESGAVKKVDPSICVYC